MFECPKCKTKNDEHTNYCKRCGHQFPKIVRSRSRKESSKDDGVIEHPLWGRVKFH